MMAYYVVSMHVLLFFMDLIVFYLHGEGGAWSRSRRAPDFGLEMEVW